MAKKYSKSFDKPDFKSEAEEADWWVSPAGKRYSAGKLKEAMRKGVIETESRDFKEVKRLMKQDGGRAVLVKNGLDIRPTDPAILAELVARVKAKQTLAISLRIPVLEVEAAKAIAAEAGIGYQTVLKEAISKGLKGLRRAG